MKVRAIDLIDKSGHRTQLIKLWGGYKIEFVDYHLEFNTMIRLLRALVYNLMSYTLNNGVRLR